MSTPGHGLCKIRIRRSEFQAAAAWRLGTFACATITCTPISHISACRPRPKGLEGYWETVDRMGAEPNPYRAGYNTFVAVADNDAHAEKLYSDAALYFYDRCLHIYPGYAMPPGYVTAATIRKGIMGQIEAATAGNTLTWKHLVDGGAIIAGSPETVAQKLAELCKTYKIGHLMMLCHFGNLSNELVCYNTERIAKEVLPKLRPLHSEWEDRWWPKETGLASVEPAPLRKRA